MAEHDSSADEEREMRIQQLKDKLQQMAGGTMVSGESSALPAEERERFWERVMAFETGPFTTDFDRLIEAGIELPEPDAMDDETLTAKLWEVIHALAGMRVFLDRTDHLSDRELYSKLRRDTLHEEIPVEEADPLSAWHVDVIGTGSEEDIRLFLKYYADEEDRQRWRDVLEGDMPPHEELPFDRDRHLPEAYPADLNEAGKT